MCYRLAVSLTVWLRKPPSHISGVNGPNVSVLKRVNNKRLFFFPLALQNVCQTFSLGWKNSTLFLFQTKMELSTQFLELDISGNIYLICVYNVRKLWKIPITVSPSPFSTVETEIYSVYIIRANVHPFA